jgi:molecular chaperone DnaK (HSP70)
MKFDIDVNGILNVEAKELSEDGNGHIVNLIIKMTKLVILMKK